MKAKDYIAKIKLDRDNLREAKAKQQAALKVARDIFEYHGFTDAIQQIDEALNDRT